MVENFSTCAELKYHKKVVLCLESPLHLNNKRMRHLAQNLSFIHHMPDLVFSFDLRLLQTFHGMDSAIVFPPDMENVRKASFSDYFQYVEILQVRLLLPPELIRDKNSL